jgi:uncharacterized protein DUF1761
MIRLNYLAIVVAAVAVFVFAADYYIALARPRAKLSNAAAAVGTRPRPWVMALELFKSLLVASVVAGLVSLAGISDVSGALKLGLALWAAFPVVLLVGSVTQEGVPWKLGAVHAGDWLAKLLIISVIVTVWR